jgi:hypothetical protein
VTVDSCFPNYEDTPPTLLNGLPAMPGDDASSERGWASVESPQSHWVQLTWPQAVSLHELTVYWMPRDASVFTTARRLEVQVPAGKDWRPVYQSPAAGENPAALTTLPFNPLKTDTVRVLMPAGQGPAARPNLFWCVEVQAR